MMAKDRQLIFNYKGTEFPFIIGDDETIITSEINRASVWEENQLCLYDALIPMAGTFVDIGANVGINSIFAKLTRSTARVISVEPEPENFRRLAHNTVISTGKIFNMAIADRKGSIGFAGSGTNAHISSEGEHVVPCDTLDNFTAGLGLTSIDLLKIDVEGYTDLVLSEAADTLAMSAATIIEFSLGDILNRLGTQDHETAMRHSEALFDKLRPHFKHFYYISRNDGLIRLTDTDDLFELMFVEEQVGDVLALKELNPALSSISSVSYAFRYIRVLLAQNHKRMLEIMEIGTA